jgi:hypothetical protein
LPSSTCFHSEEEEEEEEGTEGSVKKIEVEEEGRGRR